MSKSNKVLIISLNENKEIKTENRGLGDRRVRVLIRVGYKLEIRVPVYTIFFVKQL